MSCTESEIEMQMGVCSPIRKPAAIVFGGVADSLLNFRGELLKGLISQGRPVYALSSPEVIFASSGSLKEVSAKLAQLGAIPCVVPFCRTSLNPWKDIPAIPALLRLALASDPELVLAYTLKPILYAPAIKLVRPRCRLVGLVTGLGSLIANGGKKRVYATVVKRFLASCLRFYDALIFQNPDDRDFFVKEKIVSKAVTHVVVSSGVNLNRFPLAPVPLQPFSFLLMARLLRDKGIIEYCEAARLLKPQFPSTTFKLVGPFDSNPNALQPKDLRPYIDSGEVDYLGVTGDPATAMQGCSVYVLPSYREGTPRTALEAASTGRPIVTTDVPGCRETVEDGVNGFLVPVRDVSALVERMQRFLLEPTLAVVMGTASRAIAERKFDVQHVNAQIISILNSLKS